MQLYLDLCHLYNVQQDANARHWFIQSWYKQHLLHEFITIIMIPCMDYKVKTNFFHSRKQHIHKLDKLLTIKF